MHNERIVFFLENLASIAAGRNSAIAFGRPGRLISAAFFAFDRSRAQAERRYRVSLVSPVRSEFTNRLAKGKGNYASEDGFSLSGSSESAN